MAAGASLNEARNPAQGAIDVALHFADINVG
jgi:hypothetical protein